MHYAKMDKSIVMFLEQEERDEYVNQNDGFAEEVHSIVKDNASLPVVLHSCMNCIYEMKTATRQDQFLVWCLLKNKPAMHQVVDQQSFMTDQPCNSFYPKTTVMTEPEHEKYNAGSLPGTVAL